jgi:hypothetical protein
MRKRFYRFGESFMERGAPLYGRCRVYPWRAWRIRRVFGRVIRVNLKPLCERSANSQAFNSEYAMTVVLAYQWRRHRNKPRPPPAKEPAPAREPTEEVWLRAA